MRRLGPLVLPRAVRTPDSGTPLSLSDIIAFESELPSLVHQAPEQKADELITRASRVLEEVSTLLVEEPAADSSRNSRKAAGPAVASRPAAPAGPAGGGADGSTAGGVVVSGRVLSSEDLSRAVFGGTAQVSEQQASITRQALQSVLERRSVDRGPGPAAGPGAASSSSSNGGAGTGELVFGAPLSSGGGAEFNRSNWRSGGSSSSSGGDNGASGASAGVKGGAKGGVAGSPSGGLALKVESGSVAEAGSAPSWAQSLFSPSAASASSSAAPTSTRGSSSSSTGASSPSSTGLSSPPPPDSPSSSASAASTAPAPAPARARPLAAWAPLAFAEVDLSAPTELLLKSEESMFAERAKAAVLPPLQSVVDLTSAARPPTRGLDLDTQQQQEVQDAVSVSESDVVQGSALGRRLQDGAGRLADGTRFEKLSGVDKGADGYVKHWEVLRGVTGDGTVQWEECWWQASNRYGLRELGAFKKGTAESGAAWVEEWKEVLYTHPTNLRLVIERTAHKWARDESSDEWEEKWGECFEEAGRVNKWADKWAKAGSNVWHERWGEDYDGRGACQKWTDKWAERLLPGGGQEQWGDKWTETFGHGKGTKHGEVWNSSSGGSRYNRWWNEEHFGDGRVRKWGNSTSGEYWDTVEHMDTYYNPVPHFGFRHAVGHSPQLWSVPLPAADEGEGSGGDDDGLGVGLDRL